MVKKGEIFVELVDNNSKIKKDLDKAMLTEINRVLRSKVKKVRDDLKISIGRWIFASPEFVSLSQEGVPNGLNAQLGLSPGQGALSVEQIKRAIIGSIEVNLVTDKKNVNKVSLTINIQPSDMRNILGIPAGVVITENGSPLEWLNWLINLGTSTIVFGFSYKSAVDGRSGGGRMESGGSWRIPPQFSGTIDDNFITRALNGNQREIQKILEGIFNG